MLEKLASLGLEQMAILLNNCAAHPDEKDLVSEDGKIVAMYFPPNVTSLIQPMDQGVLKSLKWHYKNKLLHELIIEDENGTAITEFLKIVNTKVTAKLVAEAWDEIKLRKLPPLSSVLSTNLTQAPKTLKQLKILNN